MEYKIIELEKKEEWIPKQKKGKGKSKITKCLRRRMIQEYMKAKYGYDVVKDV